MATTDTTDAPAGMDTTAKVGIAVGFVALAGIITATVVGNTPEDTCACSTGTSCEQLFHNPHADPVWRDAPLGLTLSPGDYRGDGCAPKACVEQSGQSSWPDKCPLK